MKIPLSNISIRENRQRKDLGNIVELATSLQENGQISPILVKPAEEPGKWVLVAGERRCTAARALSWTEIEGIDHVRLDGKELPVAGLTDLQLQILEYEENVRRKDINWKEACCALARLHLLKQLEHGFAPAHGGKSDSAWTERKMADFTGYDRSQVHYMLAVAKELERSPDSPIHECKNYTEAFTYLAERALKEVEKEKERRRQLANPTIFVPEIEPLLTVPSAPGNAEKISITPAEIQTKPVVVYIHGYRKPFIECQPDIDFFAGYSSCVLGYNIHNPAYLKNIKLMLKESGGYGIFWDCIELFALNSENPLLNSPPFTLIWNRVRPEQEEAADRWPWAFTHTFGHAYRKAPGPLFQASQSSVISSLPHTDLQYLPAAVVEFSLSACTLDGLAVHCLDGIDPVHVAELGRIPIFFESDPKRFEEKVERLRSFYLTNIPGADIQLRNP